MTSQCLLLLVWIVCMSTIVVSGEEAPNTSDCFTSTQAMIDAQLQDPPITDLKICANTQIEIGVPTDASFTSFTNGEPPLLILRSDVRVSCGDSASPADNCILSGGWVQILSLPQILGVQEVRTDNLVVEGVSFTGELTKIGPSIDVQSAGIALTAPGINMKVMNCIWDDFRGYRGASIAHNPALPAAPAAPKNADVTFSDVLFKFSKYEDCAFCNTEQTMNLEFCIFEELVLNDKYVENCNCNVTALIAVDNGDTKVRGCTFEKVEFYTSMVHAYGNSDLQANGNLDGGGLFVQDEANRKEEGYCPGGISIDENQDEIIDGCFDLFSFYPPIDGSGGSGSQTSGATGTTTRAYLLFVAMSWLLVHVA